MAITVVFLAFVALSFALAPLHIGNGEIVPGSYIVVFKDDVPADVFAKEVLVAVQLYEVPHRYTKVLKGYNAKLNDEQVTAVRSNPWVKYVEADQVVTADACVPPVPVGSWGLTRVSQQANLNPDDHYTYPDTAGQEVVLYILDTGIYVDHADFEGAPPRATFGWKAEPGWSNLDGNGHGTHVASTSGGNNFGIARKTRLVAVKVLGDSGSGTWAGVIGGIDWTVLEASSKQQLAVINMSLGGGRTISVDAAADAAVDNGVVVVVAAGNNNGDACNFSPAAAPKVLTVGATEEGINRDVRSYYSNWGTCVNIFGPGTSITAAWIGTRTALRSISGTSMASPHVAGIAALLRSDNRGATAQEIQQGIVQMGTPGTVTLNCAGLPASCNQTPNIMAWNGCNH